MQETETECRHSVCFYPALQMGANIMGAVLSVLYAARNGLIDCEVRRWPSSMIHLRCRIEKENSGRICGLGREGT